MLKRIFGGPAQNSNQSNVVSSKPVMGTLVRTDSFGQKETFEINLMTPEQEAGIKHICETYSALAIQRDEHLQNAQQHDLKIAQHQKKADEYLKKAEEGTVKLEEIKAKQNELSAKKAAVLERIAAKKAAKVAAAALEQK